MMGRDDIDVGVGGEGGILDDGTVRPDVGGYLPIIDQGMTTTGGCRFRQAIPKGLGGRLDTDTNFGLRKRFLPQGSRRYTPIHQPTAQQLLIEKVSKGPVSILMIGAHTNIALFMLSNPSLKRNIKHIYVMGGSVRCTSSYCPKNSSSCERRGCGNLFTGGSSNPYAEFNMFADPFAAYQVFRSGVPITLVPLDATNTVPVTEKLFEAFEMNQSTYEAQYAFLSLETSVGPYLSAMSYFMWDSFTAGVAVSLMRNSGKNDGENDFAEMEYMNITIVTSNKPFGISDGSNPFFDNWRFPKFNLTRGGVHSGHVQTGLHDPFCISKDSEGKCQDGYTRETSGSDSVSVLVATKAKPNKDSTSELDREFYVSFLEVLNRPEQTARFNFSTQFPYYREEYYIPDFSKRQKGKPVVLDMDMSPGDFLSLFFLLKVPVEIFDLKAIMVSPTGWANAATVDVVYDVLHMMGRDDIPVGLGDVFAVNQSDPNFPTAGDCKYEKAVPQGYGGFLDSDTLYGLARDLPRSPRRYTAENRAPRNKDRPDLRQPLALEVWENVVKSLDKGSKITVLTNGPLTTLAKIISSEKNSTSVIKEVCIVGGHINHNETDEGNVFTIPSNKYSEFNMFLDPLAAKIVLESDLNITLIPLATQRRLNSLETMLNGFRFARKTPEALFVQSLLTRFHELHQNHHRYQHMDMFLGEILGAVFLGADDTALKRQVQAENVKVIVQGNESTDGRILIDRVHGKRVNVLEKVDTEAYYEIFASRLSDEKQSAVIGSFDEQKKRWNTPPPRLSLDASKIWTS
ncbi:PREDICTED: uncharacterized protein LOC104818832 isoform X2 [Tarenaya hassleriana]|nr:PREDICTED: uncharacterized protein LOC104818832 isoform X2 [Tarenaya hassleriana]